MDVNKRTMEMGRGMSKYNRRKMREANPRAKGRGKLSKGERYGISPLLRLLSSPEWVWHRRIFKKAIIDSYEHQREQEKIRMQHHGKVELGKSVAEKGAEKPLKYRRIVPRAIPLKSYDSSFRGYCHGAIDCVYLNGRVERIYAPYISPTKYSAILTALNMKAKEREEWGVMYA